MGERVLFQVVKGDEFGPVVYGHWAGTEVASICFRLKERMKGREGDVPYTSARLVQECIDERPGNTGFGVWNATGILTEADSHGDGGVVLIRLTNSGMEFDCSGGYWQSVPGDVPKLMSTLGISDMHFRKTLERFNLNKAP